MAHKRTTFSEDLSTRHLPPDISDTEITFQIPASVSGENLLAEDDDFFRDLEDTFTVPGIAVGRAFTPPKSITQTTPAAEAEATSTKVVEPIPAVAQPTPGRKKKRATEQPNAVELRRSPRKHKGSQYQLQESLLLNEPPPFPAMPHAASGSDSGHLVDQVPALSSPEREPSSRRSYIPRSASKPRTKAKGKHDRTPSIIEEELGQVPDRIPEMKTEVGPPPIASPNPTVMINATNDSPPDIPKEGVEQVQRGGHSTVVSVQSPSRSQHVPTISPPSSSPRPKAPEPQPTKVGIKPRKSEVAKPRPVIGSSTTSKARHSRVSVIPSANKTPSPPPSQVTPPTIDETEELHSKVEHHGKSKAHDLIIDGQRNDAAVESPVESIPTSTTWEDIQREPVTRSSPPPTTIAEPASPVPTSKNAKDLRTMEVKPSRASLLSRARERIAARREHAGLATARAVQSDSRPSLPKSRSESSSSSRKSVVQPSIRAEVQVEATATSQPELSSPMKVDVAKVPTPTMDVDGDLANSGPEPVVSQQPPVQDIADVLNEPQTKAVPEVSSAGQGSTTIEKLNSTTAPSITVQETKSDHRDSIDHAKAKPVVQDTRQTLPKTSEPRPGFTRVHRRTNSQPAAQAKGPKRVRAQAQPASDSPTLRNHDTTAKESENVMRMEVDEDIQRGGQQVPQSNQPLPQSLPDAHHTPPPEATTSQIESEITGAKEQEDDVLYPLPEVQTTPTSPIQPPQLEEPPTPITTPSEPGLIQEDTTASGPPTASTTIPASTNVPDPQPSSTTPASASVNAPSKTSKTLLRGRVRTSVTTRKVSSGGGAASPLTGGSAGGAGVGPSRIQNKNSLKGLLSSSLIRKRRAMIDASRKSLASRNAATDVESKKRVIIRKVVSDAPAASSSSGFTKPMEFTFNADARLEARKTDSRAMDGNTDTNDGHKPAKPITHVNNRESSRSSSAASASNHTLNLHHLHRQHAGRGATTDASANPSTNSEASAAAAAARRGTLAPAHHQSHHGNHDVPDFKAIHAMNEQRLANQRRKLGVAPVVPEPFDFKTEIRAKERGKFDGMIKEKEKEMERIEEEKRRLREEEEKREIKELRKKAVPKAHEVPEWYKERKKAVGKENVEDEKAVS
ncbi:hypothetical protein AX16_001353 [Volvariella volvacea WC 439]|nr:hypothetical protein AX16_001353 [Volvariella volvacea WC 439]